MASESIMKKIIRLLAPIFVFPVLFLPYYYVNSEFLVEWLGCGCNRNTFNANSFTYCFWLAITLAATVGGILASGKGVIPKKWLRVVYVVGVFIVSFGLAAVCMYYNMWN